MMEKCKYINGESLERHNWGGKPIRLNYIPTNINSPMFEKDLIAALEMNSVEGIDRPIIELLWGDIQLGKRVQSCIIMWFSVHIMRRPVLYVFRNLTIDQEQLQDDISGMDKYNFNIQFVKSMFDEFTTEIQTALDDSSEDFWTEFRLPDMIEVTSKNIDRIGRNSGAGVADIFCCLMNNTQLERIKKKFSEYVCKNKELMNITVLVDESDLMSPTTFNDSGGVAEITTKCEQFLANIYNMSKYVLHITGTAHSLLYNVSTIISTTTQVVRNPISKVHKMVRTKDYYGLFNDSIVFNTTSLNWWKKEDVDECESNDEDISDDEDDDNNRYEIVKDYGINIKRMLSQIISRPLPSASSYNSVLISEEKIKVNQFALIDALLRDFPDLFVVIYHGGCLRLYLARKYETEILKWSVWESENASSGQRLNRSGGVYGPASDIPLPNNYCYFDINPDTMNIKMVYKLLRVFFDHSTVDITTKTAVTITGKYGERGYSFTSDNYGEYPFHLTDQYFVSHSNFNCTDISQRMRLQGKYADAELENGTSSLTLWTTLEFKDLVEIFYLKFIRKVEEDIMYCNSWNDISLSIEKIFDNGDLNFKTYVKYLDSSRKRRNIKVVSLYDASCKGFHLPQLSGKTDAEIEAFCISYKFPKFVRVNTLITIPKKDYRESIVFMVPGIPLRIKLRNIDDIAIPKFESINSSNRDDLFNLIYPDLPSRFADYPNHFRNKVRKGINGAEVKRVLACIKSETPMKPSESCTCSLDFNVMIIERDVVKNGIVLCSRGDCFITHYTSETEEKSDNNIKLNPVKNKNIYMIGGGGDTITHSKVLEKFTRGFKNETQNDFIDDALPNNYYWTTPDLNVYLFSKNNKELGITLNFIKVTKPSTSAPLPILGFDETRVPESMLIASGFGSISEFISKCCIDTVNINLRFGICEIYMVYKEWCRLHGTKFMLRRIMKAEFEAARGKESELSGVNIANRRGKRGYNVMVSLV